MNFAAGTGTQFCRCRPERRGQRQPEPSGARLPVQLDSPVQPEVPPPLAPRQPRGRPAACGRGTGCFPRCAPGNRRDGAGRSPNDARPDASAHVRRMAAQPQHRTAGPRPGRHLHHARLRSGPARRGRRLVPGAAVRGAADRAGWGARAWSGSAACRSPRSLVQRLRWWQVPAAGHTSYRAEVVLCHAGELQLPGTLAATELLSAEDGRGGRYGLVRDRHTGYLTATLRVGAGIDVAG